MRPPPKEAEYPQFPGTPTVPETRASMRPPPKEAEYPEAAALACERFTRASMRPPPKEAEYLGMQDAHFGANFASMRPPPKEAEYTSKRRRTRRPRWLQ